MAGSTAVLPHALVKSARARLARRADDADFEEGLDWFRRLITLRLSLTWPTETMRQVVALEPLHDRPLVTQSVVNRIRVSPAGTRT
jgi:hypothetical protein